MARDTVSTDKRSRTRNDDPNVILRLYVAYAAGLVVVLIISIITGIWVSDVKPHSELTLVEGAQIFVAMSAGGLGALIRQMIIAFRDWDEEEKISVRRQKVSLHLTAMTGVIVALFAYALLKSGVIVEMIYKDIPNLSGLTVHGIAIVAGIAGLLGPEVVGRIQSRATLAEGENQDGTTPS